MAAQVVDLHVEQGADYRHDIPVEDEQGRARNLAGWTARAAVRHSSTEPALELDTHTRAGRVTVTIPGPVSAAWTWRRARYQINLTGPKGQTERLVTGRIVVDPQL